MRPKNLFEDSPISGTRQTSYFRLAKIVSYSTKETKDGRRVLDGFIRYSYLEGTGEGTALLMSFSNSVPRINSVVLIIPRGNGNPIALGPTLLDESQFKDFDSDFFKSRDYKPGSSHLSSEGGAEVYLDEKGNVKISAGGDLPIEFLEFDADEHEIRSDAVTQKATTYSHEITSGPVKYFDIALGTDDVVFTSLRPPPLGPPASLVDFKLFAQLGSSPLNLMRIRFGDILVETLPGKPLVAGVPGALTGTPLPGSNGLPLQFLFEVFPDIGGIVPVMSIGIDQGKNLLLDGTSINSVIAKLLLSLVLNTTTLFEVISGIKAGITAPTINMTAATLFSATAPIVNLGISPVDAPVVDSKLNAYIQSLIVYLITHTHASEGAPPSSAPPSYPGLGSTIVKIPSA